LCSGIPEDNPLFKFWKYVCSEDIIADGRGKICFSDNTVKWGDSRDSKLFVRSCFDDAFKFITERELAIVNINGTPGIGKSLFGFWFMYKIVMDAKSNNKPIPSFVFSSRWDKEYLLHVKSGNPIVSIYSLQETPSYVISDTIPKPQIAAKILNMHISSVNDEKRLTFHNEIISAGRSGGVYTFPYFSFTEYLQCDGHARDEQELQCLYEIFFGNLRLLRAHKFENGVLYSLVNK